MLLPVLWLHDYCDPGLDIARLEERLTMTGTKVERVYAHGVTALDRFVVGRVLAAERHPDADRLTVCRVDVGDGEPKQIVCGAPNVAAGQTVAVARPGAVMPDGTKLGAAKLRGVASDGMILAEDELAIGTDHTGIIVLDDGAAPGTPLVQVLPIATDVLELEVTPNRPDCLSIYGLAREVHAATGAPLAPPPWKQDPGSDGPVEGFSVEVQAPELCPRFTLRLFEDVKLGPSPPWLKARLMAAGQRPISNVVDVTNYVMLLTGQPMHAFDADLVAGGKLIVRRGRTGERMTTLDEVERTLDPDVCVIEDGEGPTSIAGIMGGARSEVNESTTRVLMEAATWNGPNIQRTSTRLGLRTEASGRFEKQLSPESGMEAQAVAAQLMIEVCGARLAPGTIDVGGPGPAPQTIRLREARVGELLGAAPPRAEQAAILERLGYRVADAPDGLDVSVPHWRRNDVTREADLVEEVGRIWGLDKLPSTLPSRRGVSGRLSVEQRHRRRAEDALTGCGLDEIVGWSFTAPGVADELGFPPEDPRRHAITIANPMSESQSAMRTTLLASLRENLERNVNRGNATVRIFEVGAVYLPPSNGAQLPDERLHVGALLHGALRPATWREPDPPAADFFAAKGALEAMLGALRVEWAARRGSEPFLHPGRSARVLIGGEDVGWIGELHPRLAGDLGTIAGFEIDFRRVLAAAPEVPQYEDVTSFPAVREDIAVVVPEDVPAADVVAVVREAGAPLLRSADVFDVYRGPQVGEGRASLALRLQFRAGDRTLTDREVAHERERIVGALRERLGAELRG